MMTSFAFLGGPAAPSAAPAQINPAGPPGPQGAPGAPGANGAPGATTVSGLADATPAFKALNTDAPGQRQAMGAASASDLLGVAQDTLTALNGLGAQIGGLSAATAVVSDGTANTPTPQAAVDLAAQLGTSVELRNTVQAITSPLAMRPGVLVRGVNGGGLSKTGTIVDFQANAANGAALEGCILDGGWDKASTPDYSIAVNATATTDVRIVRNTLRNLSGSGIVFSYAVRPVIEDNRFDTYGVAGIGANASALFSHDGASIRRNKIVNAGQHGVLLVMSADVVIESNTITDQPIVGHTVNVSGPADTSTITSVSGPGFANVRVGEFMVLNGGLEYSILSKQSNTSLTAKLSSGAYPSTLSGVPASASMGDQINVQSCSAITIRGNIQRGGTAAVVVWDDGTNLSDTVLVEANRSSYAAAAAFSTQGTPSKTINTVFRGNVARNSGYGGLAMTQTYRLGIFAAGSPLRTMIEGNTLIDDQTTPTMLWGVAVDNVAPGQVTLGTNSTAGAANDGVRGAIPVVSLSGWGSTSTVNDLKFDGTAFSFTVNDSGSGQAANPNVQISHVVTKTGGLPQLDLTMEDRQGNVPTILGSRLPPSASVTTFIIAPFTSVAGRSYLFRGHY